jgi:hypothetical protein
MVEPAFGPGFGPREELVVIRTGALLLALAVAQPALAQDAPTPAPKPSPTKPSTTKPAAKKPAPPKPDAGATAAAQHGPCIGVIPHVGDHFAVKTVGFTAFGNDLKEIPIEAWGLDDLVVARVRAAAGPGIAVRRIAYPANAFEPSGNALSRLFRTENDFKSIVQTIAGAAGCERYVVVLKAASGLGNTNQAVEGIGVVNWGYLFALTSLFVFDGHSFDVLKKGYGTIDEQKTVPDPLVNALLRTNPIHGPSRKLEQFRWSTEPDAVVNWPPTLDTVMGLRDMTRALLAASLDNALPKLLAPKGADEE